MCPFMIAIPYDTFDDAMSAAYENLLLRGQGHVLHPFKRYGARTHGRRIYACEPYCCQPAFLHDGGRRAHKRILSYHDALAAVPGAITAFPKISTIRT